MNNIQIKTKLVNLMRLIRVAWFCTLPVLYIIFVNICWFSTFEKKFWFSCVCSIIIYKIIDIVMKEFIENYASYHGVHLPSDYN